MASTGPVAQMYEQALTPVKGWFRMSALDKSAPLVPAILTGTTTIPAGRVAYLNSSGQFDLPGRVIAMSAMTTQMPIFLWQGSGDPDVYNSGTSPATGVTHFYGMEGGSNGIMSGLVATGGYEVQTTEFVTSLTYAVNELLTTCESTLLESAAVGGVAAGKITNVGKAAGVVIQYSDWVCGVASLHVNEPFGFPALGDNPAADAAGYPYTVSNSPVGWNAHKVKVLTLWTYFLPSGVNNSR